MLEQICKRGSLIIYRKNNTSSVRDSEEAFNFLTEMKCVLRVFLNIDVTAASLELLKDEMIRILSQKNFMLCLSWESLEKSLDKYNVTPLQNLL